MPLTSHLFAQSPRWFNNTFDTQRKLPDKVISWVYETGSLTQRLRRTFGNQVSVKVLLQTWHKPFLNERLQLAIPQAQFTLIREVQLCADDRPLILARSIIPQATIDIAHRNLSHLGSRPLGEVIFAYPNLQRLSLEYSEVPCGNWNDTISNTVELRTPIWGRRSVYAIPAQPLLVSEFFMPALLETNA